MRNAQQAIEDITERYQCRIHIFTADVGDESEVAKLLERLRAELPPLAGVAHLAGVLDDALLSQQRPERFRTTLAPKAFGACHLDRLTKNDDLDFFIMFFRGVQLVRFTQPGQLGDRQRAARRPGRGKKGARPDSTGALGRTEGTRRSCGERHRTGQASSMPTGSVPRSYPALLVHRFSTSRCRVPSDRKPKTASCSGNYRRYRCRSAPGGNQSVPGPR
jgi:hypothetical protein